MHKRWLWLAVLPVLASCHRIDAPNLEAETETQPVNQAHAVYVDVRTIEEYNAGHVRDALHIPYDLMAQRWRELEPYRNQRLIVYCRSGRRAGVALEVLKGRGFAQVENGGGLDELAVRGAAIVSN